MSSRRPPDILRKSHAHSERNRRAAGKRELEHELEAVVSGADSAALLIDLDGVVYRGEEAVRGAPETIDWLRSNAIPILFVTNTTSRPRTSLVDKLAGLGIDVVADEILTPPDAAAAWLTERGCRRLMLLVPEATSGAFADFDCIAADAAAVEAQNPAGAQVDAVVVGDLGRQWSFDLLNAAFRRLMTEPRPHLIALGMTRYWNAPDGLRLDTAPFVAALSHASSVEPTVLGKPAPAFFEAAVARLGVAAERCWMIGDDMRADVAGAQSAGLSGILVKTGKFRPADLESGIEPALVLESIADLPTTWRPDSFSTR